MLEGICLRVSIYSSQYLTLLFEMFEYLLRETHFRDSNSRKVINREGVT